MEASHETTPAETFDHEISGKTLLDRWTRENVPACVIMRCGVIIL
jgi:hypothetical protein